MKSLRILSYLNGSALRSIRSGWRMYLLTVGTIAIMFFIVGTLMLIFQNIRASVLGARGEAHLSIYFRPGLEERGRDEVQSRLCLQNIVKECVYRSASDAKALFVRDHPDTAEAVNSLKENPFPASMEVDLHREFRDTGRLRELTAQWSKERAVEHVDDGGEWAVRWIQILTLFDAIMKGIAIALGLATIFVISNTIRLVVYARRDEVDILSLVGASDWMIRFPFLLEGMIQGVLGSLIALGLLRLVYELVIKYMQVQWGELLLGSLSFFPLTQLPVMLCAGALLGLIGSSAAVGRFLKP